MFIERNIFYTIFALSLTFFTTLYSPHAAIADASNDDLIKLDDDVDISSMVTTVSPMDKILFCKKQGNKK